MAQTTTQLRRQADCNLIEALQKRSSDQLEILSPFDQQAKQLRLRALLPSSKDDRFPKERTAYIAFTINFPARYPFEPPTAKLDTPIYHPNVFANMTICLGAQWSISEGLDLFVARILRLLTYDPQLVNIHSAANGAAARWYTQLSSRQPSAFPTVSRTQAQWIYEPRASQAKVDPIADPIADSVQPSVQPVVRPSAQQEGARKIIQCVKCQQNIRLPSFPPGFKSGIMTCRNCKSDLTVDQNGNCSPS